MNQVAKAVMAGIMPMMFGMPRLPVGSPIMLILKLVLATGASSNLSTRFLVTRSSPQKVKKMVTSIPLPSAAQPMMGSGFYYLMEKKNGEWLIKEQVMAWIS